MNLRISKNVILVVDITDEMVRDYKECQRLAEVQCGDGKDCNCCLLNLEGYETGLCEVGAVVDELERRMQSDGRRKV